MAYVKFPRFRRLIEAIKGENMKCSQCEKCPLCRKASIIILSPIDCFMIAKHLKITTKEFVEKNTLRVKIEGKYFPRIALRDLNTDETCYLYKKRKGCLIFKILQPKVKAEKSIRKTWLNNKKKLDEHCKGLSKDDLEKVFKLLYIEYDLEGDMETQIRRNINECYEIWDFPSLTKM